MGGNQEILWLWKLVLAKIAKNAMVLLNITRAVEVQKEPLIWEL